MEKHPHGRIHVTMEATELGNHVMENPQHSSGSAKRNLSDSEKTLSNSFGEIQKVHHDGEPEVDSAAMFSKGKQKTPVDGCVTTLPSSIRNIKRSDHGDGSKAHVSAEVVAFGKQEVCSDGKEIDLRVTTLTKIIPGNEEGPIAKYSEESPANIQIGKKVIKRAREEKIGHKSQVYVFISLTFR
jgi:hypothetical protein